MQDFAQRLSDTIRLRGNPCVVGIDPDVARMPAFFRAHHGASERPSSAEGAQLIGAYAKLLIDVVAPLVPAIKPQSAYFERYGWRGMQVLEEISAYARSLGLQVILDVKRGDLDVTSEAYAAGYLGGDAAFAYDAITLSPFLGMDSLEPFFRSAQQNGRGVFVCVRTSNAGAMDFQAVPAQHPLSERVAQRLEARARDGERGYSWLGAVVGATYPEDAARLRSLLPRSIFLVPGMGAQRGDARLLKNFFDRDGAGAIVSSSRAINYPAGEQTSLDQLQAAVRRETLAFVGQVRAALA